MDFAIFADDVSQDLAHALDVAAELGVGWLEIRSAWGKNLVDHKPEDAARAVEMIRQRGFRVRCVAAPLFKCRLDGQGTVSPQLFHARERDDLAGQSEIFAHACRLADQLETNLVRCFSFWRTGQSLDLLWPHLRDRFNWLVEQAERARVVLALENDFECNLGTAGEAAQLMAEMNSPHLRLLWDPGNSFFAGAAPFPDDYGHARPWIAHIHLKDARRLPDGAVAWTPVGDGEIDLLGQLRALQAEGYGGVVTLENHYVPVGGDGEAGVRASFAGLRRLAAAAGLT